MEVFYFKVHYCCENYDVTKEWEEHDEYGFVLAKDFVHATEQIADYYGNDLMSVEVQYVGDIGMISVDNKEIAEAFKKSYLKTHYGEDEE